MGQGLAWRGGRKRWCTGIFEKSKTLLPNRGGWRCNPASGGYREAQAPTFFLTVGSEAARRGHLWPFNFPAPVHVISRTSAGQAQPAVRAWLGCKEPCRSRTPLSRLPASAVFSSLHARRRTHERAVQLLFEELDAAALVRALGLKQILRGRLLEAAGPSEQPQGRVRPPTQRASPGAMLHAPEGRRECHSL